MVLLHISLGKWKSLFIEFYIEINIIATRKVNTTIILLPMKKVNLGIAKSGIIIILF